MRTHWHDRWDEERIGFHKDEVHPQLLKFQERLKPGRILVPLAGKTLDLWMLAETRNVTGVELVEKAIVDFFNEAKIRPTQTATRYEHRSLAMVNADILTFDEEPFDAIWDRAALIALPRKLRLEYAQKMISLLKVEGTMLLVTLDYGGGDEQGPPFTVTRDEVFNHYASHGELVELADIDASVSPRLSETGAKEQVFLFTKKANP